MGKLITFISILVFIDILFLITGQLSINSPSSIIIQSIIDPSSIKDFNFWQLFITGLTGLAIAATVIVGFATRSSDIALFIPMAIGISALVGDYITVYNKLADLNLIFATIVFIPIIIIFTLVIVEWTRGKD